MRVFKSKVDGFLAAIIVAAILVSGFALFHVLLEWSTVSVLIGLSGLIILSLPLSNLCVTYYQVDGEMLTIRSGPFCWKILLKDIKSVSVTRNPLSSPALSLDRLRPEYDASRTVLVSPRDQSAFLLAIGQPLESNPVVKN